VFESTAIGQCHIWGSAVVEAAIAYAAANEAPVDLLIEGGEDAGRQAVLVETFVEEFNRYVLHACIVNTLLLS
jgi:hypothetical protein